MSVLSILPQSGSSPGSLPRPLWSTAGSNLLSSSCTAGGRFRSLRLGGKETPSAEAAFAWHQPHGRSASYHARNASFHLCSLHNPAMPAENQSGIPQCDFALHGCFFADAVSAPRYSLFSANTTRIGIRHLGDLWRSKISHATVKRWQVVPARHAILHAVSSGAVFGSCRCEPRGIMERSFLRANKRLRRRGL